MRTTLSGKTFSNPKRRRWWLRALLMVVLAGFACLGVWVYRGIAIENDWRDGEAETEAREPRWRLADREADLPPIDDADNAGALINRLHAQAPKLSVSSAERYDEVFAHLKPTRKLNAQQIDLIQKQFDIAPAAIAEARRLKDMPRGRFAVNFSLDYVSTPFEVYSHGNAISDWLLHNAYLLAQSERCDEALENTRAIVNIGRTLGDDRFVLSHYCRIRQHHLALEAVEPQGEASQGGLLALERLIDREIAESNGIGSLKGVRAGFHFCFDNLRAGKWTSSPFARFWFRDNMTWWDKLEEKYPQWMLKYYPAHLRFTNRMIEIAKLPLHEQKAKFDELADTKDDYPLADFGAGISIYACMRLRKADLGSQAKLRTTLVALACERYRLEHQRWPSNLEALVAEKLLPALPVDPVDGQPLRYRQDAEGIIVYSLGADEKDDRGNIVHATPVEQRDRSSFVAGDGPGVDVGFRLWNVSRRRDAALPPVVLREIDPASPPTPLPDLER